MLKSFVAGLFACIAVGPVLAQTAAPPSAAPAPARSATTAPLTKAAAGQMLASDIRGTRVRGGEGEDIGEIADILIDRDGRVAALIVGVGGFLGIGEKYVAIPLQAFETVVDEVETTASTRAEPGAGRSGASGTGPGMTGTPGLSMPPSRAAPVTRFGTSDPDRFVLRSMTKADLQNAPAFGRGVTGSSSGTSGGDGTAPPR
jgi:hypothetical protein